MKQDGPAKPDGTTSSDKAVHSSPRDPGTAGRSRVGSGWRPGPPWRWDEDWEPPWAGNRWADPEAHRRRRMHGRVIFAILIFVFEAGGAHWASQNESPVRALDHYGYGLLALGCLAMIWRMRLRVPMLAVTIGSIVTYVLLGYPNGPVFLSSIISIIGALRARHRYGTWAVLATGYLIYVVLGHIFPTIGGLPIVTPSLATAILVAAWIIVACAVGEGIRNRTERVAEIARMHAEQQRVREEQRRRKASEERLRIAQELHDVLGHHLSLINVQAGVGLHLMDDDPAQARESLQTIKQASAEALGEVRAVLGVLRDRDERAPRSPSPTLANLRTLIDEEHTMIDGTPRPLPPDVDRAAYRIIQESLTNVRRHAGADAVADVRIAYQPSELRLMISDNGVGPSGDASTDAGNGIVGMRTRAEALGGSLTTEAGAEGGFVVNAVLPLYDGQRPTAEWPDETAPDMPGDEEIR